LQSFYERFAQDVCKDKKNIMKYISKYNNKSMKNFKKLFGSKRNYFYLSSIKKKDENYELSIIDRRQVFLYYVFKFLVRKPVHKLVLHKSGKSYKIVSIL
jgi:hypothetical protein